MAAITKTKPATEAAFAEADISAWSKIVPTNINAGEEGIVMLAAHYFEGKGEWDAVINEGRLRRFSLWRYFGIFEHH
ncbi:MAG: hypothetical protein LBD29_02360 [Treponema sp.]|jgi:hypothetical protein|nr:hypothetical protein [Treponema sp.]